MNKLTKKHRNVLVGILGVIVTSLLFAVTLHSVDQYVINTQPKNIELDTETLNDYNEQITEFLSYKTMDKLYLTNINEKKGNIQLVYSDGYSRHLFVFKNDTLYQYGSSFQGDLIHVDDISFKDTVN